MAYPKRRSNNQGRNKQTNSGPMNQSTKSLTLAQKVGTIEDLLEKNKTKIKKALGKWMTMDRMVMLVVNSIRRNPSLGECTPISIFSCVMQSAQLRLEPDDMRGLAYLIPFWNSKKNAFEAQFMPGYKGLVKLAKDSGEIRNVYSRVVYENEHFTIEEGLNPILEHVPLPPKERGNPMGTYTVVQFKDGEKEFTYMWEDDIMSIRKRSKAANNGPWTSDPDEMRKKTTIRRAMKTRDLSPALSKAVALDELIDTDVSTREEFETDDFMIENMSGKPPVAIPREKATPSDVKTTQQNNDPAPKDDEFVQQIKDMINEMGWESTDERYAKTNAMIAENLSSAVDYVQAEYEQWLQSKGTKKDTTVANGQAGKSGSQASLLS